MHRRISHSLSALRQDFAARLGTDFIHAACRAAGHSWCDSCLLTPAAIIHWFLIQVLHGNTALTHVSLMAGRAFTASAFCQGADNGVRGEWHKDRRKPQARKELRRRIGRKDIKW
jgi:hypothetical protein